MTAKITVENVKSPGHIQRLDADKYAAMKQTLLKVLPPASPGSTVSEMQAGVLAHLPEDLFPQGAKAGWWFKAVQLDLEAKGIVARTKTTPLRLHKA